MVSVSPVQERREAKTLYAIESSEHGIVPWEFGILTHIGKALRFDK
jgi:hypothetical protein